MKNMWSSFLLVVMMMFTLSSFAQTAEQSPHNSRNTTNQQSVGDIKIELIGQMKKDGYLSEKMASEVATKYVTNKDFTNPTKTLTTPDVKKGVQWSEYMSWVNFIKTIAVICFLIVFHGVIANIIKGLWFFIIKVPVIVYQTVFLSLSLYGTFLPETIWASQAFYIALFSSIANIIVLGWIVTTYKWFENVLEKLLKMGVPPQMLISFLGMIYFGALAFMYESSIFGFFAVVCLSSIFSFGLSYVPGVLYLNFKESMLSTVVFGHMIVLGVYGYIFTHGMFAQYTEHFNIGLQYYCTIGMSVALLVGSSPWYKKSDVGLYVFMFIAVTVLATFGYFFWDLKVIASIIFCFFILFVLEWIGYIGYKAGFLVGTGVVGAVLYGGTLLFEKYSSLIILSMN